MTKVLILSVSAGNGHVRAAQALAAAAPSLAPSCTAVHIDTMAHVSGAFRRIYTDWYIQLVNRAPELWSYLHQRSDVTPHHAASQRLRRGIERLSTGALLREIRNAKPDAVICTHFLPAELLMRERRNADLNYPVWLQITDYDLHNMWLVPEMTGYLAANEEVAFRLRARGIPADRVHVTGIPVMPAFSKPDAPTLERDACAAALGLEPSRSTLLMASGGAGVGDLASMVERALGMASDFQVIAVAGRNAETHARLSALALRHPGRMIAVGFTDEMHKLMAAADLVVTKPGGLTVSECLALGKPMLLISPIPGQEEHNAGFLMEEGAAWLAYDAIGLDYKVERLMADRPKLRTMAACSLALGKPQAAATVLQRVLQSMPHDAGRR
ncbi:Processive diacylglycerol beta-glucosyltransferase [Xanthomonas sp. GW]|uniref:MGDG synthase family glycosyltransferase n=1 Tax=Xanthomonas sp. GW TaxID=2724121 RepID=UPI00163AB483|nr:glycosyltransferase [Xanthomonas sp. GW]QNH20346.1 Processive diacylglycerol beta-glucosyltransferase [Xanthomonas sp. GW]